LAANVVTGLLSGEEHGPGGLLLPLIAAPGEEGLAEIHEVLGNLIVVLACLHILGVVADWILTRENIVRAMITGEKTIDASTVVAERRRVAAWRVVSVALLVALAGFALFGKTDFARLAIAPSHSDTKGGEEGPRGEQLSGICLPSLDAPRIGGSRQRQALTFEGAPPQV
jgi:hypothetical protein